MAYKKEMVDLYENFTNKVYDDLRRKCALPYPLDYFRDLNDDLSTGIISFDKQRLQYSLVVRFQYQRD